MIPKFKLEQLRFALPKGRYPKRRKIFINAFPTKGERFRCQFFLLNESAKDKQTTLRDVTAAVSSALKLQFDPKLETAWVPFPNDAWDGHDYTTHQRLMLRLGVTVWNSPIVFQPQPIGK